MKYLTKLVVLISILLIGLSVYGEQSASWPERHSSQPPIHTDAVPFGPLSVGSTASQLAAAILTPNTAGFLVSSSLSGSNVQAKVLTNSLQGFPILGNSYAVLSTGIAADTPGSAGDFMSVDVGGPFFSGGSPEGYDAYDVVALTLRLNLPSSAESLTFSFKFGTEENPDYLNSGFQDFFTATLRDSSGNAIAQIARLPNNRIVTVDNAAAYSNAVGGWSESPTPPFPSPNDTVYNAVTSNVLTASYDITSFAGSAISIVFQLGDASDSIYDSMVFIDNLCVTTIGDGIVTKYAFLLCSDPEGKLTVSVADMESALKTWWLVDHVKVYKWWEHNNLDLRRAVEEWFEQPDPDDLAIFYYVGHGSPKLIGSNSTGELLSYQALSAWLQSDAGTTIIILDACYSGSAITAQESENLKGSGRWILTGTNDSEPGKGWDYFGGLVRYMNFTKPFLDAMSWESPSIAGTDNFISLREAFNYADEKCNGRWLTKRQQDPQIWPEQRDKDFIVIPQRVNPTGWWPSSFVLYVACPIDITITDPNGKKLSQDKNEIGENAFRVDADFDGDGQNDIFCRIYVPIAGEYSVQVVPLPSASPTDTFTLLIGSGDSVMTITREIQVADIPDEPYRIEVTVEGIEPVGGVCTPSQFINYGPNPVPSQGCVFWLDLPDDTLGATVKIFDIDGAELLEICLDPSIDRYPQTGRWLPQDDQGRPLGTGLYLYVVEIKHTDGTTTYSPAQKMVIQQ